MLTQQGQRHLLHRLTHQSKVSNLFSTDEQVMAGFPPKEGGIQEWFF